MLKRIQSLMVFLIITVMLFLLPCACLAKSHVPDRVNSITYEFTASDSKKITANEKEKLITRSRAKTEYNKPLKHLDYLFLKFSGALLGLATIAGGIALIVCDYSTGDYLILIGIILIIASIVF